MFISLAVGGSSWTGFEMTSPTIAIRQRRFLVSVFVCCHIDAANRVTFRCLIRPQTPSIRLQALPS